MTGVQTCALPISSNRLRGLVLHDILASVTVPGDLPRAVDRAVASGELPAADRDRTLAFLEAEIASVAARGWFAESGVQVLNEAPLLGPDGLEVRPDRVVIGSDGKILAAVTDATQPQIKINAEGGIVETVFKGTKRELKEGYNMVAYSNATLEWYEQAKNFTDYATGKTADELNATETKLNDEGHQVFVDEALYATCSISVDGMINVLVKAAGYAA